MWCHYPVTVLQNTLHIWQYYTHYISCNIFYILHISQWVSPHLYIPFSSSLKSCIFSFDLTKWSFSFFGLQKATRQVDKNTALNLGELAVSLCAFFNILWALFSAGWYVRIKVRLSCLSCLSRFLTDFLYSWNKPFGSHYEPFLSFLSNPYSKSMFKILEFWR